MTYKNSNCKYLKFLGKGCFYFFLTLSLCLILTFSAKAQESPHSTSIIPYPINLVKESGRFVFTEKTVVALEDKTGEKVVKNFLTLLGQKAGFIPKLKVGSKKGDICLIQDKSLHEEAYYLEIKSEKIWIKASTVKGLFYALQTLRQLLPPSIEGKEMRKDLEWSVPTLMITDEPRFGYRGLMIDVARCFIPKENLLRIIDCMGMLKLNALHLHLTDDNGWRLEIKKYPLLTEVGSKRADRKGIPFPDRRNQRQGEPVKDGGYYTQDDIREIVSYASERQINVIPEIALPAHSNAALAAYPMLACPIIDKYIGVVPGLGGSHSDILFCAGNENVYTFLQDVIDEVISLFPSQYIHLGGDAVKKTHWEDCPICQELMKKEDLNSAKDLLGYFMRRMDRYVRGKGRKLMGWEEVMDANLSKGAVVFDWHGYGHGAVKAGKHGHQFIVAPTDVMYLNRRQGPQWFEPMSFEGENTLEEIYKYEPIERYWTMSMRSLLLGMQASLWTEFCETPKDVEYLLFPRLAALAEAAWSAPISKRWERFLATLDNYTERWILKGIEPARSMYNVQHEVVPEFGNLKVTLKSLRPDVEIRYTIDGTEPRPNSTLYRRPWLVKETQTVKCATFKDGKQLGKILELPLVFNEVTGKNLLRSNQVERRIVNGVRGSLMCTDSEWASWTNNDSIALTFDMAGRKKMKRISLGCLNDYGMGIHKPKSIEVWLSDNEVSYWKVSEKNFNKKEVFYEGRRIEDLILEIDDAARYVRVILRGAGACPETHVRPNQDARVYIDEVFVEIENETDAQ